ncbi:MAG: molecular chaperone HtpG, partial [Candidatus Thiodiazotropha sp.]
FEAMSGDQAKDSELIGQFGVGFYSAFIVADKVTLMTRRASLGHEHGVRWESEGQGSYSIENIDKPERGTDVILHLREDEKEFLEAFRLRSIISKFSDHITLPVEMQKEHHGEEDKPETPEFERVNTGTALWMRNRSDISDEEYNEFYRHVSHDFEDPLLHVHNRVEGNNEYTALLYVPQRAPFDLWDRDQKHGVKLFVRRVFIMDEAEKLMPRYLRFVKGIVDSDDLPLNVSREILQHNRKIDTIRQANVKRVLGALEKLAEDDADKYLEFWKNFGKVMKEGPAEDYANKDKVAGLLRFASTHQDGDEQTVSLADYISRMPEGQEKIYYITADTPAAARFSPHLELLKKKGIEVLLLSDRVDEWLVTSLTEYQGKTLQSVAKGELDLGELEDKEEQEQQEKQAEQHKQLLERMKSVLDESVKEIRVSHRLTDSPACLVVEEYDMSANLARVLKSVGQDAPQTKPIMEINATHPLVERLEQESDEGRFGELTKVLFDQSQLAEGGQLDDPAAFVRRLNTLMLNLAGN